MIANLYCINFNYEKINLLFFVGACQDYQDLTIKPGSASIYHLAGGGWTFQTKLYDTDPEALDNFGYSLSIAGNYVIVGVPGFGSPVHGQGSARIYRRLGNTLQKYQNILDPAARDLDNFGGTVAIDATNNRFLIGVHGYYAARGKQYLVK